ncbi:MAG: tol-pal system protein YbgF [Gemmatimonadetes bacterium]|nr:tol-pal system protein YbgF [Gemmatimonadota bacterium]
MSGLLIRRALLAPVVILTTGACFATRNDVRILQMDLQASREEMRAGLAESAARDAANRRALDSTLAGIARGLALVSDTVRSMHATTMRLRGDVREDLTVIRQQLITVEERVGASARRIQDLRAELEADAADRAAPVTAPKDSTKPPVAGGTTAPAGPGPAQLYQMGQDQLRRGSWGSARGAFNEILSQFPSSDIVPDALFAIGQAFENEGNGVSADSVYALVVQRHPKSDKAPTALYKRATALRVTGQAAAAQVLYKQIVDQYPRSDAAVLAEGFLGTRKP